MPWTRVEDKPSAAQEKQNPRDSPDWINFGLIALIVAGFLSMVATWFLVAYLPIPDDNANYIALLGFLLVVFFDLIFVFGVAASKLRQGQIATAIKGSLSLLLLGPLAATVVGSLPLLWRRLTIAMPWIHDIPGFTLVMLWVGANHLWMRRWRVQGDRRLSRGWLIAHGSFCTLVVALSLLQAVSELSGSKAWRGALYLMVALLFGFIASKEFVEIWKRRQARPPESVA